MPHPPPAPPQAPARPKDRASDRREGLQHRGHRLGRDVAAPLRQLAAVPFEDDRRRPAVVFVAIRQVGPRILIHAHGDVFFADQRDHPRIGIGHFIHDVAPVAPHRLEVQEHQLVPGRGALENAVRPRLPGDAGLLLRPRGGDKDSAPRTRNHFREATPADGGKGMTWVDTPGAAPWMIRFRHSRFRILPSSLTPAPC
jgi:hypothetical protein